MYIFNEKKKEEWKNEERNVRLDNRMKSIIHKTHVLRVL